MNHLSKIKDFNKLISVSPLYLDASLVKDINIFRKILELSMKNCLWNGFCGQS